jgi:hypothetical protein
MSQPAMRDRERHLLHSPRACAEARRISERSRRARAQSPGGADAPAYPVATLALLLLGAWTFVGVFMLGYPYSVVGQNSELRALGAAIVLMLCGLWIRHLGFSAVAATLAGVVGAAMTWAAVVLPHGNPRVRIDELVVGVLVMLVTAAAVATRPTHP